MPAYNQIYVVKTERDFFPSGSTKHASPTGLYTIGSTPGWASGEAFWPYSYIREDQNPTGGVYASTHWAISLSGDNKFYWNFSGDGSNNTQPYLIAADHDSKKDMYLPGNWETTGASLSTRVYIDDTNYTSGIFNSGAADLNYKITGISVLFVPNSPTLQSLNAKDTRAFQITVDPGSFYGNTDFHYYFGSGDVDSLDAIDFSNRPSYVAQTNPFEISVEAIEKE